MKCIIQVKPDCMVHCCDPSSLDADAAAGVHCCDPRSLEAAAAAVGCTVAILGVWRLQQQLCDAAL